MFYKFSYLLYLIIFFINFKSLKTFNVNFYYNYNLQVEPFNTEIYKRDLAQSYDRASFSLNGFERVESVPVLFPIDICIFNVEGFKYAAALHKKKDGTRNVKVLKMMHGNYELIADIATPNGIGMDCVNFNNKGYVAIALNLTEPVMYAKEGSPIYEIAGNQLRAVQYFAAPNLMSVYLRVSGNDFFLLHTYSNSQATPHLDCPYFKWSGSSFNEMGRIPCSNARQLAPFSIDYESYVAVANYADQEGRTSTNSEIYKFSREKNKFILMQKLRTNGAVDVKYFSVPINREVRRQHFLVFGNSRGTESLAKRERVKREEGKSLEADSVFYVFDKGQFVPYQKLSLYAVQKFLPVQNVLAEKFILLVACSEQDIKIYNFNDWKFEESNIQFTEGALGKGVSNMRIYQENEKSYLVIANERMLDNETNIFLPIFKQEEDANALRQQIIDWAKIETQRLERINIKDLRNKVEEKLKHLEQPQIQDVKQANIQTVATESLVYPKLKMSKDYWTALNYLNQAFDALQDIVKQKQRLKRETDNFNPANSPENLEYIYESLNVNTLKINKQIKAKKVNQVLTESPEFKNIEAHKIKVNKKYKESLKERQSSDYMDDNDIMRVRNLQIQGKLNEHSWEDLRNNTLKRQEEIQFAKAAVQIDTLKTDTMVVNSDKVNEQNLASLVPVDGGKYVIHQDVQFAEPITANEVQVIDRLNNLHVFNGKFDVLLKKSNKTQVIEGLKNVTNIRVLEPITIAGKMMGRQLEAISPNKFIHEPLVLQGTFMINGDVHIAQQLNTLDLIDLKEKLSVKQVLDLGIRMDKSLTDVNLKFEQPLKANNSLVSFVNQNDLQRLVKLNQDDIQVIEGAKIFNGSLEISRGFSEVKNLNGVDMEKLESNAFLKNNNQTIKVPMKIGKITAESLQSPQLLLNNKNLSDYLTLNGNQSIQGSLIVENLKAQFLLAEHLNTDAKIFKQNLEDIYQQKSRNAPQDEVFKPNHKFHGSIYVQNLILNSTINNKSVEDIENQLLKLEGNIKYVGNFKFNYPMNVTHMTFQGKLNDIPADEFGKCWLQKRAGTQEFTAAQTFAGLKAEEGIQMEGKLNGFTMEDFYTKTYWINRDEYIENINFENPIEIKGSLTTQTLNNYIVPQDVLYINSKDSPLYLSSLTVDGNFTVEGNIFNLTSINGLNLHDLQEFLEGSRADTLYVENAYFSQNPPLYKTLSGHDIKKTLDSVWLANENVVLPHHVEIANAYFGGLLEFEGPINNMNLDYLKDNYFSKTKPQEVSVEMVFSEGAVCEKDVNVNELQVFGSLIEAKSEKQLDFNEFVQNTMKTSGPHIISGNWSILEAIIHGNLNDVLINKLNLKDDVVLNLKPSSFYHLKAPKIFENAHLENLYADPESLVNQQPVANWIQNAVYLYENYTIYGLTSIDSLNVYNDIQVLGKLNNVTFNEYTLLLQNSNQHIPGHMKIVSHLAEEKRFLTNNIENLHCDFINGQYMPSFMENLVQATASTEIKSHLTFKTPLKVEKYDGPEGVLTQNQWSKRNVNERIRLNKDDIATTDDMVKEFEQVKGYLRNITESNSYKIDKFDVIQNFQIKADIKVVMLSLKFETSIVDILAVFDSQASRVIIYKWIPKINQFRESRDFEWLPHNLVLLQIIHKRFETTQPIELEYLKMFIQKDLQTINQFLKNPNNPNNYYEIFNENCVNYPNYLSTSLELYSNCLNSKNSEKVIILSDKAQQILFLNETSLALLTNNSILIYNLSWKPAKITQKLSTTNAQQIALGSFKNFEFMAVLSKGQSNSLNHGYVEIFRSENSSAFTLFQSFECLQPEQIKFSHIEKSNDFLIHILTGSFVKPYLIYQYQGIMGFQQILSDSILPSNSVDFHILNLYSNRQYLVALMGPDKVTFIEMSLKQIQ